MMRNAGWISTEGIQGRSKVAKNFHSKLNGKRGCAKFFPELESVVSLGWLSEGGEFSRTRPIELSRIDYNTSNGGA